jgi:hypothetical protein
MGRVVHLLRVNVDTGATTDLLEGTPYQLPRADLNAEMFDISPDGRRIVFMYDPAAEKRARNCHALAALTWPHARLRRCWISQSGILLAALRPTAGTSP